MIPLEKYVPKEERDAVYDKILEHLKCKDLGV